MVHSVYGPRDNDDQIMALMGGRTADGMAQGAERQRRDGSVRDEDGRQGVGDRGNSE